MVRVALLAAACALVWLSGCGVSPSLKTCRTDDQIESTERAAIEEVAARLVDKAHSPSPADMLDEMTAGGRAAVPPDAPEKFKTLSSEGEPGRPRIVRTLRTGGIDVSKEPAFCFGEEAVIVLPGAASSRSAFVIVAERTPGEGERRWTLWLKNENGRWRVEAFHVGIAAIAGRDGGALWSMAREQRRLGHTLNAAVLYDATRTVLYRGPFLQEHQFNQFMLDYQEARPLLPSTTREPLTLSLGEQSYAVAKVRAASAAEGVFAIEIVLPASGALTESEANRLNRQMIDAMNTHRPEWRAAFDGVLVTTPMGDGRIWTTAYIANRGYIADAPRRAKQAQQ